jgi:F-type H+-transporting ATPase subunit alpha
MPASEQIAALIAVTGGAMDKVPIEKVLEGERKVRMAVREEAADICLRIEKGEKLTTTDLDTILKIAEKVV